MNNKLSFAKTIEISHAQSQTIKHFLKPIRFYQASIFYTTKLSFLCRLFWLFFFLWWKTIRKCHLVKETTMMVDWRVPTLLIKRHLVKRLFVDIATDSLIWPTLNCWQKTQKICFYSVGQMSVGQIYVGQMLANCVSSVGQMFFS